MWGTITCIVMFELHSKLNNLIDVLSIRMSLFFLSFSSIIYLAVLLSDFKITQLSPLCDGMFLLLVKLQHNKILGKIYSVMIVFAPSLNWVNVTQQQLKLNETMKELIKWCLSTDDEHLLLIGRNTKEKHKTSSNSNSRFTYY